MITPEQKLELLKWYMDLWIEDEIAKALKPKVIMMFEQTGTLFCMPNYTILPDFEAWLELRQKQEIVLYIPKGSCTLWEFPNANVTLQCFNLRPI